MFVQETKSILLSLDQDPRVANNSQHTFLHEHSKPNFQHLQMLAAINSSTQFMQYPTDLQLPAKNPQELSKLQILASNAPPYAHGSSYNRDLQKLCSKCEASMHASSFISRSKETNQSPGLYSRLLHKLLECFSFKIEPTQLMAAFKMALAMAIGAFFGFWFNAKKGYWADITLALGYTGPAKGGSFRVAVLRSLGTVSGSIYGLLVVMATTHFPVMRLVALIPWVVFTSFLRQSKIFGYAGAISALTGAIVILARTNKDSSDQEFTVIRIVEAFLGMASFIIVEVLVFPRRAASMVKPEIVSGLSKMEQLVSSIFDAFSGGDCDVCGGYSVMDDLKAKEKKLRSLISCQNALVKEASEEPQFWFAAFPAKIFMKLMEQQGKIMEMLHFSMAALEELKQVGKETKIPMNRLLRDALNDAMRIMEEKVVPTFAFLEKVMSMKTQQQYERFSEHQHYQHYQHYPYQYQGGGEAGDVAAAKGRDIEAAGNLPELERLMRSELTARNSRAFKHCEFGDVAVQRGKRFMDAFEKGVMYVANELNLSLQEAAAASPQHPPFNSEALQFINHHHHHHHHHHHQIQHSHSHSHSPVTTSGIPAAPSPISRSSNNNNNSCCSSSDPTSTNGVHSLTNTVLLSLGTLAFALNGLLHHTSELEKTVHELLQEENPWNLIDFWDTSKSTGHIWWGRRKSGRP